MQLIGQIQSATTAMSGNKSFIDRKKSSIGKSTFRLSPLRKVAKTAKVNLNRYWGIFSQLYGNSSTGSTAITTSSEKIAAAAAFAEEMEQNRQNEILEAETFESSQNSLNSKYKDLMSCKSNSESSSSNIPLIHGFMRQRCCLSYADARSLYSSFSSSIDSLENEMDIVVMGSVDSLVSHENSFHL